MDDQTRTEKPARWVLVISLVASALALCAIAAFSGNSEAPVEAIGRPPMTAKWSVRGALALGDAATMLAKAAFEQHFSTLTQ